MTPWLRDAGLDALGARHGFGLRTSPTLQGLRAPRQVHGVAVARVTRDSARALGEADAVVSTAAGVPIGVVTADCVPILLAAAQPGSSGVPAVAAIHAGWRGLAAGVVEAGIDALREAAPGAALLAAIGPCAGRCCYEVDAPVLDALAQRYPEATSQGSAASRPGHAMLDLAGIAAAALGGRGLADTQIGRLRDSCTICDGSRFHSYRRDAGAAGRLVHWIEAGTRETSG